MKGKSLSWLEGFMTKRIKYVAFLNTHTLKEKNFSICIWSSHIIHNSMVEGHMCFLHLHSRKMFDPKKFSNLVLLVAIQAVSTAKVSSFLRIGLCSCVHDNIRVFSPPLFFLLTRFVNSTTLLARLIRHTNIFVSYFGIYGNEERLLWDC